MIYQVYTQKLVTSDKFKTGKDQYLDREVISDDNRDIIIGRFPVMVKSDLCWMKGAEKGDCDFDHGGYFLIKGAEKVSSNNSLSGSRSCMGFVSIVVACLDFVFCHIK